ncbi:hypothetical protein N431DRAFT_490595 [Stipitochalara longipes BDJ]|nr:hypothetical protein N431DRAFT_490595 [Stipitochalara longipes BDJ]
MLQVLSGNGQTGLLPLLGTVPSVLTSTFHDPFDSLAIPISHRMHSMIHHFIFYHALKTNPPIYHKEGLPALLSLLSISLALGEAACIHAMVALSLYQVALIRFRASVSSDWGTRREIEETRNAASHHVMEAVRLLNKKFENPKESLSITSLISAAMLGSCTSFSGDKDHFFAHHNGILKMVEIRGGIDTIPRGLAHQISRSDTKMAWHMKAKPMLPMYKSRFLGNGSRITALDIINPVPEAYLDASSSLPGSAARSPFLNDIFENFLCENLFIIACNLHAMTHVLEMVSRQPSKMGTLQREAFEDTYCASKHAIASFPRPDDTELINSYAYFRQHSWSVAAMIYINCSLRTWDIASPPIISMVSELISSLKQSDLDSMWSNSPEVLVWILFVGATASWERLDRGWILLELRHGIEILYLKRHEELEELLKSLLYPECMLRETLREIWEGIFS